MNLNDLKISGTQSVNVSDSLKAPLLKLNVTLNSNTTIPNENSLTIYVDTSLTPTNDRKTYLFDLESPLARVGNVSDEFILEPTYNGTNVIMSAYVVRNIDNGQVLSEPVIEQLGSQTIVLFKGINYIYTNYTNPSIEIVYPKNSDLAKYFLTTTIYASNNENRVLTLDDIYFKDCFTEVEDGINAQFKKLTIKCMDSVNNNFSLDCDGNLVVNSITTRQGNVGGVSVDDIYPVGSVYFSVLSTNPSILFGGSWEQINGYYLYAGTGGTTAGSNASGEPSTNVTGSTAITINQMPSHTHVQNSHNHTQNSHSHTENNLVWVNDPTSYDVRLATTSGGYYAAAGSKTYYTGSTTATNNSTTATNQSTGGGQGHTHTLNSHTHSVTPLRFELYAWKRIS